jgi:transcriptional regulator with XRE-family HTH domain
VPDNSAQELGEHIHQLRVSRGLSLRGLASTAKVDYSWLSKLEHGQYESPDPRSLYRLARALDVEVNELYLAAGYASGEGLPGMDLYLRSKYDLPDEAISQLLAHFDLINDKYQSDSGEKPHDQRHHKPT